MFTESSRSRKISEWVLLLLPLAVLAQDVESGGDNVPDFIECPNGTSPDTDGAGIPNLFDCNDPGYQIPEGNNVFSGRCVDRDCDGTADASESTETIYAAGRFYG